MEGFVYRWTNNLNKKMYIGSHIGNIDDGYVGSGTTFKKAFKKYGIENFTREILELVEINNTIDVLICEKKWLDYFNAYYDKNYYNIAKDVMGGDTKAGWSEARRNSYKQKIKEIWANRTTEERSNIHAKIKETFLEKNGITLSEHNSKVIRTFKNTKEERSKIYTEARARITPEERSAAAKRGKANMTSEERKNAARLGVLNRTVEREKLGKQKRKETIKNRTEERKLEVFNNKSKALKGKKEGIGNPKARCLIIDNVYYPTLRSAIKITKISEPKLYKRLYDVDDQNCYYITKEEYEKNTQIN